MVTAPRCPDQKAGLYAIGIAPRGCAHRACGRRRSAKCTPATEVATARDRRAQGAHPALWNQAGNAIEMLRAPDGATIEEIMVATGWQSHTVRGAMAGR